MEPNLPSEHTIEKDVVRRLKHLIAKGAGQVAIDATLLEEVDRPVALLKCKKKKNMYLAGPFACQRRSTHAKKCCP